MCTTLVLAADSRRPIWGTDTELFVFVLVTGLVIVGLTFGMLVRWGLKPSPRKRNRAALAALAAGIASVAAWPFGRYVNRIDVTVG